MEICSSNQLTEFQRYILNRIIASFDLNKDLNIYEVISAALCHKDISSNQQPLIIETYDAIKSFLVSNEFVVERKDKILYRFTDKSIELKEILFN